MRAINWNIWLERNARIFNSNCLSADSIIIKIDRMILSWYNAAPEAKKAKLDDPMTKIKRSLDFIVTRDSAVDAPLSRPPSPGEE